jgi:hypothetical protein
LLLEPSAGVVHDLLRANHSRLTAWDYDFQGKRANRLREQVRSELLETSLAFLKRHGLELERRHGDASAAPFVPLVVTGHQPELFHPGVWIKNFAAGAIARACGGLGLNLIIDSDIPKTLSVQVPTVREDRLEREAVEFDRFVDELPYEDLKITDEARFRSFRERVRRVLGGLVSDPVMDAFWPSVERHAGAGNTLGLRFSLARRELEAAWGISNLELPQSAFCETEGFLWFVCHLLAHLPRYQQVYNAALTEYRHAHGIRSKNHPVPALAREGDWLEAPFWVWRASAPRRKALLVRQRARDMQLRIAGDGEPFIELPLSPSSDACCAVERLRGLTRSSIRLRTRALTTTLFGRFLVGDLFIHGIGGAKYEGLGDRIARRFFGIDAPGFLTLSMTVWPGIPTRSESRAALFAIDRQLRDLHFNPDRHLDEPYRDDVRNIVEGKRQAIAGPVASRRQRVARCRTIRECNEALRPFVGDQQAALLQLQASTRESLRWNQTATNREFPYVIYSAARLKEVVVRGVEELWPTAQAVGAGRDGSQHDPGFVVDSR